ncbi:MAG: DUF368 domain-containing protein [Myxococcales bacterium]
MTPPTTGHGSGLRDDLRVLAGGFCIGVADLLPGVSGGTVALALGLYRRILTAIAACDLAALRALTRMDFRAAARRLDARFALLLVSGIAAGLACMLWVLDLPRILVASQREVYALLFGLVVGSAVILNARIDSFRPWHFPAHVLGIAAGYGIVHAIPVDTPNSPPLLFVSGLLAVCATLLPGVSGAYVLLLMGKLPLVLTALTGLDLLTLLPFAAGALLGLLSFARAVSWAMTRAGDVVVATLTGMLVGSLWRIWPWQLLTYSDVRGEEVLLDSTPYLPTTWDPAVVGLAMLGLLAALAMEVTARRSRGQTLFELGDSRAG